jgi:hypothetical protein
MDGRTAPDPRAEGCVTMADVGRNVVNELLAGRIPAEIAKSISQEERAGRLTSANQLMADAAAASDPALRRSYASMAAPGGVSSVSRYPGRNTD